MGVSTDGLSRLSVGGATLSRIASAEKMASIAPAAPRRWPVADLVEDMVSVAGRVAEQPLDGRQFDLVAHGRGRAVGVDVVDVGGADPGPLQSGLHAAIGAVAALGRSA